MKKSLLSGPSSHGWTATDHHGVLLIGAGFIGGAVALCLRADGGRVGVLSRRGEPTLVAAGCEVRTASQENAEAVREMASRYGTVIHLACPTTPAASVIDPELEEREHLRPLSACLGALRAVPPRRLIFVSSGGTLYGDPEQLPANEDAPLRPLSPHGRAKAEAERRVTAFAEATGTALTMLRPANVYGPGQTLRPGFGVVRTLFERVRAGQEVDLWGDGERDYLFIDDMVAAVVAVLASEADGIYNVGSGVGTSLGELAKEIGRVASMPVAVRTHAARPGDVRRIVLDAGKLGRATGWRACVGLAEGLARTWRWLETPR